MYLHAVIYECICKFTFKKQNKHIKEQSKNTREFNQLKPTIGSLNPDQQEDGEERLLVGDPKLSPVA